MNLSDHFHINIDKYGHKPAFIFLEDGESKEQKLTFYQLDNKARKISQLLKENTLAHNPAILLYKDAKDFILAFLACQLSGITAVPIFFSRNKRQTLHISSLIKDSGSSLILTTESICKYLKERKTDLSINLSTSFICTDEKNFPKGHDTSSSYQIRNNDVALIQYTSGSTSEPKGVIVTHKNLIENQKSIKETFATNSESVIFSWLPFHHDMGLIGNIVHSIYVGCTCIIISPYHFLQKPIRWLNAISKYRVTHSGGPNFAFDMCINQVAEERLSFMDLSSWKVAYCGSEPVSSNTLRNFMKKFKVTGFGENSFFPCYGLAEATLLVSGKVKGKKYTSLDISTQTGSNCINISTNNEQDSVKTIVGCGKIIHGLEIIILSKDDLICKELEEGEICISGPSVTKGYWNKHYSDLFVEHGKSRFLRTGDMGFIHNGELYISGRIKELLIYRGKNYYPNDLEQIIRTCDTRISTNGIAVFCRKTVKDEIIILIEIKRRTVSNLEIQQYLDKVNRAIIGFMGKGASDILLLNEFTLPRTTSGKIRRVKAGEMFEKNEMNGLKLKPDSSWKNYNAVINGTLPKKQTLKWDYDSIREYLIELIRNKTGYDFHPEDDTIELAEIGIDSLRSMEIANALNKDLEIHMDAMKMSQNSTLLDLITYVEMMIWLKNENPTGKDLFI